MGKRKMSMTMIENEQYRMVSFSKRRKGLFKKAEELSALTGARTAILVVSQAGRPHSSLSPPAVSLDSFVDEFLSAQPASAAADDPPVPAAASSITADCYESLGDLLDGDFSESLGELSDGDFFVSLRELLEGDFSESPGEPPIDEFLSAQDASDGQDPAVPVAGAAASSISGDCSESLGESPSVSLDSSSDEFVSAQVASHVQDPALSWIGELLGVEIDKSESVGELLALKEKLEGLRESVRSALDFQFVNSLFA